MPPRLRIGIPPCAFLLLVFHLVGAAALSLPGSGDSEFLIPRVGGGENHTCVLIDDDGGLRCFGDNSFGQLGNDGESTDEFVDPTQYGDFSDSPNGVSINKQVEQVGVGGAHTCVLTKLKKLLCWGSNSHGQTGLALNSSNASVPTTLVEFDTSISSAPQVSLGYQHTCVLYERTLFPKLRCWGRNSEGQLGNGNVSDVVPFNSSTSLSLDCSYVSAGWYHTCALTTNASVKCWGDNTYGQLGRGFQTPLEATPEEVNISNVKAVSAGRRHTCIIHGVDGKVVCFGSNADNQVDDDNNSAGNVTSPAVGSGVLGGALWVSAGFDHSCALAINDSSYGLYCWGSDTVGQLGMGSSPTTLRVSSVPQPPSPLSDAINLVAGHQRSYLLIANHTTTSFNSDGNSVMQSTSNQLWAWGSGSDGVLGPNAPNDEQDVPLVVYPSLQTLVVDDIILQANDVLSIAGDMIMSNNISTSISVIKDDFSASSPATAAMNISGCASFGGDLLLSLSTTPNASDELLEIVLVAYDSLCENYTRFQSVQVNLTITPSASTTTASASSRAPIGRKRRGGQCARETYGEKSYSVLIDPSKCGDEGGDGGVADGGGGDDGNVQTLVLAIAVPLACCLAIISVVALVCILAAALLCTALVGGGVTSIAAMREINFDGEDLDGIFTTASSMEDSP